MLYWMRYQTGVTALYHATVNGHTEVIELLLDRGADVISKTKPESRSKNESRNHYKRVLALFSS